MRDPRKSFLRRQRSGRLQVDWRETLSIAVGETILTQLLTLQPYIRGRLLDVGCGRRPYKVIYEPLTNEHYGTEVAFSIHGTHAADAIATAERLAFTDASFDTILCTEVLEHTRQPFEVMREFARLLQPGGYAIITVPFIYPLHEVPHDYWRFTPYGLTELCRQAGLSVIQIQTKGGVDATAVALGATITQRAVNLISIILGCQPPLRERAWVRLPIAALQWFYLRLRAPLARDAANERAAWLSPGYVVLAQRPPTISA